MHVGHSSALTYYIQGSQNVALQCSYYELLFGRAPSISMSDQGKFGWQHQLAELDNYWAMVTQRQA
jgi:hypothetical protein